MADTSTLERTSAVASAVARVRTIAPQPSATPKALEEIRTVLRDLAEHKELFTFDDFPLPEKGSGTENCLYRISEDPDHRYALYVNVSHTGKNSPPHNHTTWAVVVGVRGHELNRLYERTDDGTVAGKGTVRQVSEVDVSPGTGICMMPDVIHSIHVVHQEPILHLHMYGLALDQLHGRVGFDMAKGTYTVYPPHRDIRSAS
jgi:predicted metal-dependent enzyme (double-stranded beta helix superfamily)